MEKSHTNSGIYLIRCNKTDKIYVGSSISIPKRWSAHRHDLRKSISSCFILQRAWSKHGEESFSFKIIEECPADQLEVREQHWIDRLKPKLNSITDVKRRFSIELAAKRAASIRARAALITSCPRGHEYTEANTHINKKGKRICRECARLRVAETIAAETPEQTAARNAQNNARYYANYETVREKQNAYAAAHRAEKAKYDRINRASQTRRKRELRQAEFPEARARRLAMKIKSYRRCRNRSSLTPQLTG